MMLPEGWDTYELGDLAEFKSGGTPSKQNDSYWGGAFPWVSAKDLKSHYITKAELGLTASGELQANVAPIESILVLVRGMTLLKDVPIGLAMRRVAFNQDIKALIANANVDPLFLSYFLVLQKKTMMALVNTANHGTGRLDTDLLRSLSVLLPPLPEQRKIAEILSAWDRAIETVEALIANARAQKKALMQSLLTGKHRLPGFTGEWVRKQFRDAVYVDRNSLGQNTPADFRFRYISLSDVETGTIADDLPELEFATAPSRARRKLNTGDILMATVRPNLQAFARVGSNHAECIASTGFAVLTAKLGFDPSYIYHYLFSEHLTGQIDALVVGSSYPAINSSDIQGLSMHCPSADEQVAIAQVLNASDALITDHENQLSVFRQEKSALMQQLLTGKRRVRVEEVVA